MGKKRYFCDDNIEQTVSGIEQYLGQFNHKIEPVRFSLEHYATTWMDDSEGREEGNKEISMARYVLKTNEAGRDNDPFANYYKIGGLVGVFDLLPHSDKTMIEFHSIDETALMFWDTLQQNLKGKDYTR